MDHHFDEELELYALGMLEPHERDRVDEHVRTCDACAERLGRAEGAVAALVAGTQRRRTRSRPSWAAAVAAAFALASAVLLQQNLSLHGALADDGHLLDALILGHFVHVPFSATTPAPVEAKVIYEQHGRWFEIIAERAPDWHVTVIGSDGTAHAVAQRPVARGSASYLTLEGGSPLRAIELDDAQGHAFARARPVLVVDNG